MLSKSFGTNMPTMCVARVIATYNLDFSSGANSFPDLMNSIIGLVGYIIQLVIPNPLDSPIFIRFNDG